MDGNGGLDLVEANGSSQANQIFINLTHSMSD